MSDAEYITLDRLHERHPGLTPALAQTYFETACVCLARHHEPPVVFSVNHAGNKHSRTVNFLIPDVRTKNAHANEIDATEYGAYGLSLATVESVAGMVAVRRAEKLTGADWYIAHDGEHIEDFEGCIRLEVSGINAGTSSDVNRRLQEKITQAAKGNSNLPAIAAVVGFKVLEVAISPLGVQA
ncbi:MAG TPA: hypothetical protein VKF63_01205 [Terracidiphilus sp.]|nr:hypothetical protein [Terracidiphilus sp.]